MFQVAPVGQLVAKVDTWDPMRAGGEAHIFYIDIASVDRGAKVVRTPTAILAQRAPSRARQIVRANDVLVSTVRPNLNAVAVVPAELDGATASTGFTVLRANSARLIPGFLFHWVRSPTFVEDMVNKATGASYPAITDRIVHESLMPLPSVSDQQRIVTILDKADALRRKRKEVIGLTEELLRATFLDIFGDPVTNPKSWKTVPLNSLIDPERGISYGVVQRGPDVSGGVPVVRISNIGENRFDGAEIVRTSPEISAAYRRTVLRGGELLVSIRGTVGRVAVAPPWVTDWNVSREIAVLPLLPGICRTFVQRVLLSDGVQRFIAGNVKGVAQSGINLADLRLAPVPQPPPGIVERFESLASRTMSLEQRLVAASAESDALFASLVHRAFRGELTRDARQGNAQLEMFEDRK